MRGLALNFLKFYSNKNLNLILPLYMTEQQKMASITCLSRSLLRITGANFGMLKYIRLVPTNSIMYINVLDRCLDIHYKDKKSFDTLIFPTDTARDVAIAAVEESFAGSKQHPQVKDYPF